MTGKEKGTFSLRVALFLLGFLTIYSLRAAIARLTPAQISQYSAPQLGNFIAQTHTQQKLNTLSPTDVPKWIENLGNAIQALEKKDPTAANGARRKTLALLNEAPDAVKEDIKSNPDLVDIIEKKIIDPLYASVERNVRGNRERLKLTNSSLYGTITVIETARKTFLEERAAVTDEKPTAAETPDKKPGEVEKEEEKAIALPLQKVTKQYTSELEELSSLVRANQTAVNELDTTLRKIEVSSSPTHLAAHIKKAQESKVKLAEFLENAHEYSNNQQAINKQYDAARQAIEEPGYGDEINADAAKRFTAASATARKDIEQLQQHVESALKNADVLIDSYQKASTTAAEEEQKAARQNRIAKTTEKLLEDIRASLATLQMDDRYNETEAERQQSHTNYYTSQLPEVRKINQEKAFLEENNKSYLSHLEKVIQDDEALVQGENEKILSHVETVIKSALDRLADFNAEEKTTIENELRNSADYKKLVQFAQDRVDALQALATARNTLKTTLNEALEGIETAEAQASKEQEKEAEKKEQELKEEKKKEEETQTKQSLASLKVKEAINQSNDSLAEINTKLTAAQNTVDLAIGTLGAAERSGDTDPEKAKIIAQLKDDLVITTERIADYEKERTGIVARYRQQKNDAAVGYNLTAEETELAAKVETASENLKNEIELLQRKTDDLIKKSDVAIIKYEQASQTPSTEEIVNSQLILIKNKYSTELAAIQSGVNALKKDVERENDNFNIAVQSPDRASKMASAQKSQEAIKQYRIRANTYLENEKKTYGTYQSKKHALEKEYTPPLILKDNAINKQFIEAAQALQATIADLIADIDRISEKITATLTKLQPNLKQIIPQLELDILFARVFNATAGELKKKIEATKKSIANEMTVAELESVSKELSDVRAAIPENSKKGEMYISDAVRTKAASLGLAEKVINGLLETKEVRNIVGMLAEFYVGFLNDVEKIEQAIADKKANKEQALTKEEKLVSSLTATSNSVLLQLQQLTNKVNQPSLSFDEITTALVERTAISSAILYFGVDLTHASSSSRQQQLWFRNLRDEHKTYETLALDLDFTLMQSFIPSTPTYMNSQLLYARMPVATQSENVTCGLRTVVNSKAMEEAVSEASLGIIPLVSNTITKKTTARSAELLSACPRTQDVEGLLSFMKQEKYALKDAFIVQISRDTKNVSAGGDAPYGLTIQTIAGDIGFTGPLIDGKGNNIVDLKNVDPVKMMKKIQAFDAGKIISDKLRTLFSQPTFSFPILVLDAENAHWFSLALTRINSGTPVLYFMNSSLSELLTNDMTNKTTRTSWFVFNLFYTVVSSYLIPQLLFTEPQIKE